MKKIITTIIFILFCGIILVVLLQKIGSETTSKHLFLIIIGIVLYGLACIKGIVFMVQKLFEKKERSPKF